MCSLAECQRRFPLHFLVWNNDYTSLEQELGETNIDKLDPRGRTPLHLAVSLGHLESARVLLKNKANVTIENLQGWSVGKIPGASTTRPGKDDANTSGMLGSNEKSRIPASTPTPESPGRDAQQEPSTSKTGSNNPGFLTEMAEKALASNTAAQYILHEAISTGDPEMVQTILQHREFHKASSALGGVPDLLQKTLQAPDFYMEMKWEFTSWVPLLSRVCPNDVCRIWKSGAKLRVDATLLGFENRSWVRGKHSFIFKEEDNWAELMEVNHDTKVVMKERFDISQEIESVTLESMQPPDREVTKHLTSPVVNTSLDTSNVAFERTKSGFWGWRTDKMEMVNGYVAKVYNANNINVVTKTRTEHLTEAEKSKYKAERNVLESLLGTVEHQFGTQGDLATEFATANNPTAITPEEYFDESFDLQGRDIGRPKELSIRTQKFKATLWMCEDFPLSLVEQVTPIIDLMATTSAHFAQLRDFITLQFPPGFPVKIEIPLFHVLNARITFGNVNNCSTAEEISPESSPQTPPYCEEKESYASKFEVDPSVFAIPPSYRIQENGRSTHSRDDEEDEIMQYAIQQSLLESTNGVDLSEIHSNGAVSHQAFDQQYERALQESIFGSSQVLHASSQSLGFDTELQLVMELSAKEQEEQEIERQKEEAELERILMLSLQEK